VNPPDFVSFHRLFGVDMVHSSVVERPLIVVSHVHLVGFWRVE
jgi:hypothetical protein